MADMSQRFDWRQAITPALFGIGLVVNVAGFALVLHHHDEPGRAFALVFIAANLLWLLAEAPVSLGRPGAPPREVATLIAYGLTRFATVAAALFIMPLGTESPIREAIAAAVFIGGVTLRLVAIRTLGRFYSHHVIRHDEHAIVSSGPYRLIRHPAYAGMLLGHAGLIVFFFNWPALVLLAGLAGVLSWRIRVEERTLLVLPAYSAYAAQHARLLPGVW
ncbi:protein-S-isoprenylcysteine O-methyltransferase Ste14 [Catenulispora sp. EB89]